MIFAAHFSTSHLFKHAIGWWIFVCLNIGSFTSAADNLDSKLQSAYRHGLGGEKQSTTLSTSTHEGVTTLKAASFVKKCTLCDGATLAYYARVLGAQVANQQSGKALPTLDLQLFLPTTQIWADGWRIPKNQKVVTLEPGQHFLVATRNNVSTTVSLSLSGNQRRSITEADLSWKHLYRPLFTLGVIGLSTGAALGGSGIALWAIDEKCATPERTTSGACTHFHETALAAGILLTTSATFVVTGLILLIVRSHKQNRAKKKFLSTTENANAFIRP